MVSRVSHGDTRVYVNDTLLKGISQCSISTERNVDNLIGFGEYHTSDRIMLSNQKPTVQLSWTLGEETTDPFFNFQNSGIISVEKFNIKKVDTVGQNIVSGAFLTSYSVNGSVGGLVTASASYEGLSGSFTDSGKLTVGDETEDYYSAFIPSKIQMISTFGEGQIFHMPVQSFQINLPIPRTPLKKMGSMVPDMLVPNLPIEASVSFSVSKNDVTGINLAPIVLEKGNFFIELSSCVRSLTYVFESCSLINIDESLSLEGNSLIEFNYVLSGPINFTEL